MVDATNNVKPKRRRGVASAPVKFGINRFTGGVVWAPAVRPKPAMAAKIKAAVQRVLADS